jgi:hypothetical protein
MSKVNTSKLVRDLNELHAGQSVRVLNYVRQPDGRTRVYRGSVVTVHNVETIAGRTTVSDVMGVIASDMDRSTRLERL